MRTLANHEDNRCLPVSAVPVVIIAVPVVQVSSIPAAAKSSSVTAVSVTTAVTAAVTIATVSSSAFHRGQSGQYNHTEDHSVHCSLEIWRKEGGRGIEYNHTEDYSDHCSLEIWMWFRIEVNEDVYRGRTKKKEKGNAGKNIWKHITYWQFTLNWIQKYFLNHIKVILPWVYSFFIFPCKMLIKDPNSSMVLARFDSTLFYVSY